MICLKRKPLLVGFILTIFCFLVFFFTLSDYGMNWDEPLHFSRGFAYLHFFLTGKKDLSGVPINIPRVGNQAYPDIGKAIKDYELKIKSTKYDIRPSGYQYEGWTPEYFLKTDSGHPPLNDILAALTNYIFYRKLGIMDDLNSYHLFEILTGTLMIFVVYFLTSRYFGLFAGIVASLSLFLYPLFFGEVHYNIKDPPEAAFFSLTILGLFEGITRKSWKWTFLSSVAAGFALGTKFNILFLPFIVLPWLIVYIAPKLKLNVVNNFLIENWKFVLSLVLFPLIMFFIFYGTWPYLWQDPYKNILSIVSYYKEIGTSTSFDPRYTFMGWNTYPVQWIMYTTPLITIFLSVAGIIYSITHFKKEKNKLSFLVLLWFLVPILRVSAPGSAIYGGDRQIMEFIPAMAILSGIGALFLRNLLKRRFSIVIVPSILVFLLFIPLVMNIIKFHPYEDVYFNILIGGLKGAKDKNIPAWGDSYGTVYLSGVQWMNKNAEEGARLALVSGTLGNIPSPRLRQDIGLFNNYWSGTQRNGEYLMDMIYQGYPLDGYQYEYLETYLNPVYETVVDGVPILKIWKNDEIHTKKGFLHEDSNVSVLSIAKDGTGLLISLKDRVYLTKLDLQYDNKSCDPLLEGTVHLSEDGNVWQRQADNLPILQVTTDIEPKDRRLVYFFAAKPAKYILIYPNSQKSCIFNVESLKINKLTDLKP